MNEATMLTLKLTGTKPMLMHNGRLANPLDPHTRAVAAISKKRNKTDKDLAELAQLESRGSMWETPDGLLGVPVEAVWRCLWDSAKAFKLGEDVKRAIIPTLEIAPLLIGGSVQKCDTYLADAPGRLSYRSVVINRRRTMRARPIIPVGWEVTVSMEILTDVLEPEKLVPVIQRAGRLTGIGDWRPIWGTFTAEILSPALKTR